MESELTAHQAFEAMRRFLEQFNEREPHDRKETIEQILRCTPTSQDGLSSQVGRASRSIQTLRNRG